jgi:hypothetical protein
MKTGTRWLSIGAFVVALGWPGLVTTARAQVERRALQQVRQQAAMAVTNLEEYTNVQGAAAAGVSVTAKKAWAAALMAPGTQAQARAGFGTAPISVASTVAGARVKATFNVSEVIGGTTNVVVRVRRSDASGDVAKKEGWVTSAGTITVTTDPFTLQPGAQYEARAFVYTWAHGAGTDVRAIVATISDIKWEF